MPPPAPNEAAEAIQNDPGISNNPRSNTSDYNAHAWHSLNQIFERLGKIDQKIDQLAEDQKTTKASVDKHEKYVNRVVFTLGGIILAATALWFIYENFLKDRIVFM